MLFLKFFFYNLSSYQNEGVTVIELGNENEQNVISYSQLRKSKISCKEISNNRNLLISLILPKKQAHTSRC